ncbi:winged helix-turn-helix domain-containing protein [Natronorubrum sp. FCH18a]|uniref:winged helix-turn-helix domain-containing protein n=1 Tax=Natronorubrum sp. FCH18a TaxID=3447018 RepID=UPI003F512EC9
MTEDTDHHPSTYEPDDAFAVLGNETRMTILQILGSADEPLSFSELRHRLGMRDSGKFNYHLDKLVGHFIRKTDEGYRLRQAGKRVIEAVLSGAITETAVLEPTSIDASCPYCGAGIELLYREERLLYRCPDCPGTFAGEAATSEAFGSLPSGTIELGHLPSAGLQDRTPEEIAAASSVWGEAECLALGNGVCPRCSAVVDRIVRVCDDHRYGDVCSNCGRRYAVRVDAACRNCPVHHGGVLLWYLVSDPMFRSFFDSRGIDVFQQDPGDWRVLARYDEEIVEREPLEVQLTFTVDDEDLVVTLDEALDVVERTIE